MKKKILAVFIGLSFVINPAFASEFSDVDKSHNNYTAIQHLSNAGVFSGYEDGSFQPNRVLNRAEALKVILKSGNIDPPEQVDKAPFTDVPANIWYSRFVHEGKSKGIINGNPNGTFEPDRQVKRAEFIKMVLETNRFKKENWANQKFFNDIPEGIWYAPYMNYAGKSGLFTQDENGDLLPEKPVTRSEMAEVLYLLKIILNGNNTQLLVSESENQMSQIEVYVAAKNIMAAKRASELAYDMTQQAMRNAPDNNIVLGAAKIAKAYDLLVDSFIAGLKTNTEEARKLAELVITKATEAWEANNEIQPIAKHLKERAEEILGQLE